MLDSPNSYPKDNFDGLKYSRFSQFNPKLSTNLQEIPDFMKPFFKLRKGFEPLNLENINPNKMDTIVSKMLNKKGTDIKSMTPVDAIQIAGEITSAKIRYNTIAEGAILRGETIQSLELSTTKDNPELQALYQQRVADAVPVDQILENGIVGVCRNYTRVFTAIIDSLKRIQLGAGGYALRNMYSIPAGTYNHDLCVIINIGKTIETTVVDPTNMDYNSELRKERATPNPRDLDVDNDTAKKVYEDLAELFRTSYQASRNSSNSFLETLKNRIRAKTIGMLDFLKITSNLSQVPLPGLVLRQLSTDASSIVASMNTPGYHKTPPSKSEKG